MSYTNGKRPRRRSQNIKFQTQLGMSIIRRDTAIRNSMIARGAFTPKKYASEHFVICGCGFPGCGFFSGVESSSEETRG